jgi:predicted ATPase
VPFAERIEITRELLTALKEATRAGQTEVMHRVVGILQREMLSPSVPWSDAQAGAVMAAVAELEQEVARAAPDAALFRRRAQIVVDLLSTA